MIVTTRQRKRVKPASADPDVDFRGRHHHASDREDELRAIVAMRPGGPARGKLLGCGDDGPINIGGNAMPPDRKKKVHQQACKFGPVAANNGPRAQTGRPISTASTATLYTEGDFVWGSSSIVENF